MSEELHRQITEISGLPVMAYYCNHLVELRMDYPRREIVVDMGNFLNRRRPYWVVMDEERIKTDSGFQSTREHKRNNWKSEMERALEEVESR